MILIALSDVLCFLRHICFINDIMLLCTLRVSPDLGTVVSQRAIWAFPAVTFVHALASYSDVMDPYNPCNE